jgi:hypothetical protein
MRCGTLIGDISDSSHCKVNTYDQFNYTVTCPTLSDATSSPLGTPLEDTGLPPTKKSDFDLMKQYITKLISSEPNNDKTVSEMDQSETKIKPKQNINYKKQIFDRPNITFGSPNPTVVSSLTIVSDPEAVCSSRVKNATTTPTNVSYDKPIPSKIDQIPSTNTDQIPQPNTDQIPPPNIDQIPPPTLNTNLNMSGIAGVPTTNTTGSNTSHVYKNIPFPFLPKFNASS